MSIHEKHLIGIIYREPHRLKEVRLNGLTAEAFTEPLYKSHFEALCKAEAKHGVAPTPALAVAELAKMGFNEIQAGLDIQRLMEEADPSHTIHAHLEIIMEEFQRRQLADLFAKGAKSLTEGKAVRDVYNQVVNGLLNFGTKDYRRESFPIGSGLSELYEELVEEAKNGLPGIPTGIIDLDKHVGNFREDELIYIAARPAMGKTVVLQNFSLYPAVVLKKPVLFITCEMKPKALLRRAVSTLSKKAWLSLGNTTIPFEHIRNAQRMTPEEWVVFEKIKDVLKDTPWHIEDGAGMTTAELHALVAAYQERGKYDPFYAIEAVYIDYYQLLSLPRYNGPRDQAFYEQVSEELRLLARKRHLPVIAAAQINRESEKRGDKRPKLSDLRSSGKAEMDADIVIGLYRDEYYNPDTTEYPNTIEFCPLKFRNAAPKSVLAYYDSAHLCIENLVIEDTVAYSTDSLAQKVLDIFNTPAVVGEP